ncbi:hypothetical protein V3W47_07660 [Deinococcus sp. YIM 134068]|uniref:hypothetical protein n=1 Tax=Deinococcus lichenicola TaxID=3118910 RepID=UPI002F92A187
MQNRNLANLLTIAGLASILGSITIWFTQGGRATTDEERSHGERFGIFVGLWAPTFFILANRYNAAALKDEA